MDEVIRDIADPGNAFAHLSYIFLITSMLMVSVKWLRILALASGLAAMIHFTFRTQDNASLFWEALFVIANGVQLAILLYRTRRGEFSPEERDLLDGVLQLTDRSHQRKVVKAIDWVDLPVGEVLIAQGEQSPELTYIASGAAGIEHDGRLVGVCGKGDFVGEMSLISGQEASATVTVSNPMRVARIDPAQFGRLVQSEPEIGKAFDGALNRGLAAKVLRMNRAIADA